MCPYLASFRQADNDDGDGDASENDSCGSLGVAPLNVIPSLSSESRRADDGDDDNNEANYDDDDGDNDNNEANHDDDEA